MLTLKQIDKILVFFRTETDAYLIAELYANDNLTTIWQDSVKSTLDGLTWQYKCFEIPPTLEGLSFAVGFRSQDADTFHIAPMIGIKKHNLKEVGGK